MPNTHWTSVTAEVVYGTDHQPDTVQCNLYLNLGKKSQISNIVARLVGSVSCCIEPYQIHSGSSGHANVFTFLERSHVILDITAKSYDPGQYSWPFTFGLPEMVAIPETRARRGERDNNAHNRDLVGTLVETPLPPSTKLFKSCGNIAACQHHQILYRVEVEGPRLNKRYTTSRTLRTHADFDFLMTTSHLLDEPTWESHNVFHSKGWIAPISKGASSDHAPASSVQIPFDVDVRIPRQVQLRSSQHFPFVVKVRVSEVHATSLPQIFIKNLDYRLYSNVESNGHEYTIAHGVLRSRAAHRQLEFIRDKTSPSFCATIDCGAETDSNLADGGRHGPLVRTDRDCLPTFTMWSFRLRHYLSFSFDVTWTGGSHHVANDTRWPEAEDQQIIVLPPKRQLSNRTDEHHDQDLPPSYASVIEEIVTA